MGGSFLILRIINMEDHGSLVLREKKKKILTKNGKLFFYPVLVNNLKPQMWLGLYFLKDIKYLFHSKRNLLEIWIEHGANEKIKMQIGEKLKNILNMHSENLTFYYKNHDSSLKVRYK